MNRIKMQLLAACGLMLSVSVNAQHFSFGIEEAMNRSTQLLYDPTRPQDGTTQLNAAKGWNAGIYATASGLSDNKALNFFKYKARLNYARRGSVQPAQISDIPLSPGSPNGISPYPITTHENIKNTIGYLCLDILIQKDLFRFGKSSSFYLEGGLGNNLVLHSDIKSGEIIGTSYPYNQYKDGGLKSCNLSWIAGMGFNIENKFRLFVENNKAFTPVYRSANLRVKDWSWTMGASITLFNHSVNTKAKNA